MAGFRVSALRSTKPHEYLLRFLFGGAATVLAGVIAGKFGPAMGGLFLAFPAILPASATLVETHEKEQKKRAGLDGDKRGRMAASVDAFGASLGGIGLIAFAAFVWYLLPRGNTGFVILAATAVWTGVSWSAWRLRRKRVFRTRPRMKPGARGASTIRTVHR